VPNTYALVGVAALQAAERFGPGSRMLDFGHGVASTSILFARAGFDVALVDISEPMQKFARWRFARRQLQARFLESMDALAEDDRFDVIVSLDVMEHIPDPLPVIRLLRDHLVEGGVLIMNIAFGLDPNQPEHLLKRRRGILDRVRSLGLERANQDGLLVFYRAQGPGPRALARASDTMLAAWEDARHSGWRPLAGLTRRLRTYEPPGLMPPSAAGDKGAAGDVPATQRRARRGR